MIQLDTDHLRARIFHALKSLQTEGDTIAPRALELFICESFGFQHVGDSAYYADGVTANQQLSIKTRMISPHVLKTKQGRDFQSHPEKFLGPQRNKKQQRCTNGLEIVQRRQQLDLPNDSTAEPSVVGEKTLEGFKQNILDSEKKYQTSETYEAISAHGYDSSKKYYILNLYWKEVELLDHASIEWRREGSSVGGYQTINGETRKICERINGNAKREATCFKEYKDLSEYQNFAMIKVPLPDLWAFDKNQILNEIAEKQQLS